MKIKMDKKDIDMVFKYLDAENDWTISLNEFHQLSQENRKKISQKKYSFNQTSNMNERMNLTKCMILLANKFDERFSNLKLAFDYFDIDKDG